MHYSNARVCPMCGGKTKVVDARDNFIITKKMKRRRQCVECGYKYTTLELLLEEVEVLK